MRAELGLPSVKGDDERGGGMTGGFGGSMGGAGGVGKAKRPINVKFEIPYFTTSGIQVRYLKITEPKVGLSHQQWIPTALLSLEFIANNHPTAAIPLSPLGAIHHTVGRHCHAHARNSMKNIRALWMNLILYSPRSPSCPRYLFLLPFFSSFVEAGRSDR